MPKHPYTDDRPTLVFGSQLGGSVIMAYIERQAQYRRTSKGYTVREHFATIRAGCHEITGLVEPNGGTWLVMRGAFDDLCSFATSDEAVTYVKGLFALECGS